MISRDKRNGENDKVQTTKNFAEHTGAIMGFQIPLLVIDWRGVSIMSGVIPNRGVALLRLDEAQE